MKLKHEILFFHDLRYERRRTDILSYALEGDPYVAEYPIDWNMLEGPHGYITKGRRPDCVYYLWLASSLQKKYVLHKEVCGVEPVDCRIK